MSKAKDANERGVLFFILAYLYSFPGGEGHGGRLAILHGGDWCKGTRLRAPHMPMHGMRPKERDRLFDILLDTGCIEVTGDKGQDQYGHLYRLFKVTPYGLEVLKMVPNRLVHYVGTWTNLGTGMCLTSQGWRYLDPAKAINAGGNGANWTLSYGEIKFYPGDEGYEVHDAQPAAIPEESLSDPTALTSA